jgi:hypothetical protein
MGRGRGWAPEELTIPLGGRYVATTRSTTGPIVGTDLTSGTFRASLLKEFVAKFLVKYQDCEKLPVKNKLKLMPLDVQNFHSSLLEVRGMMLPRVTRTISSGLRSRGTSGRSSRIEMFLGTQICERYKYRKVCPCLLCKSLKFQPQKRRACLEAL